MSGNWLQLAYYKINGKKKSFEEPIFKNLDLIVIIIHLYRAIERQRKEGRKKEKKWEREREREKPLFSLWTGTCVVDMVARNFYLVLAICTFVPICVLYTILFIQEWKGEREREVRNQPG